MSPHPLRSTASPPVPLVVPWLTVPLLVIMAFGLFTASCQPRVMEDGSVEDGPIPAETVVDADAHEEDPGGHALQDERLGGTLWMQKAAEFPALSRQAFALAGIQVDRALADPRWTAALEQDVATVAGKPPAIVVDVDETVLDNSPFQAQMLLNDNEEFDEDRWNEWAALGEAKPMEGAKEFLEHVASKGVEVFYVTNRHHDVEDGTRANLQAVGFPVNAETDTLLTKEEREGWGSDKQSRRVHVAQTHRILLLLGDDLNDFVSGARADDPDTRLRLAAEHADHWGTRWILFPNPVYGSWDASLFGRDYGLQRDGKLSAKRGYLRGYVPAD